MFSTQVKKIMAFVCAVLIAVPALTSCGGSGGGTQNGGSISNAPNPAEAAAALLDGEIKGELTVSAHDFVYKYFLDQVVPLFEQKYPGTKINVEELSVMPETHTFEGGDDEEVVYGVFNMNNDSSEERDYINKTSTELMSGKGADILAMDVLPYLKYIENGQIENLQYFIDADKDFNAADYRANIWNAVKRNGGMYMIPIGYDFNYFSYSASLFKEYDKSALDNGTTFTFEQLVEICTGIFAKHNETAETKNKMFGMDPEGFFRSAFRQRQSEFIDYNSKKANFTGGDFTALLKMIKEYAELGYLDQPQDLTGDIDIEALIASMEEKKFYQANPVFMLLQTYLGTGSGGFITSGGGGGRGNENDDVPFGMPADDQGSVTFTLTQSFAMNANSKNKRLAWAFLKFLISEEVQYEFGWQIGGGMSINNAARDRRVKADIVSREYSESEMFMQQAPADGTEIILNDEQQRIYEDYTAHVERYADMLNTYRINDATVADIVTTETESFFKGEKTAEEAANVIQNKISLYLNE